eukprot:TRINITY_DN7030_c0_g1_i2.p1 TRINITY_DN7030_c0_g1~~TRINITY_DN7030_c0_g1_i2.p1  ORF type:complete len:171 (+),score=22.89 TRINITY_DN7030_c0_g1_i2:620-1132(+)
MPLHFSRLSGSLMLKAIMYDPEFNLKQLLCQFHFRLADSFARGMVRHLMVVHSLSSWIQGINELIYTETEGIVSLSSRGHSSMKLYKEFSSSSYLRGSLLHHVGSILEKKSHLFSTIVQDYDVCATESYDNFSSRSLMIVGWAIKTLLDKLFSTRRRQTSGFKNQDQKTF